MAWQETAAENQECYQIRGTSALAHPSLPCPFSLPFLYFLCILRQGLTVEPELALISGSPPAALVFKVLGLQA